MQPLENNARFIHPLIRFAISEGRDGFRHAAMAVSEKVCGRVAALFSKITMVTDTI